MTASTATITPTEPAPLWARGDYPSIVRDIIPALGHEVVEAARIQPGQRVLDVAAGTGNAAIPAARAGADVVASDITRELLAVGADEAAAAGVTLEWRQADAQALPFPDASFDTVLSCVGVMFAPQHQASADELVRVVRPGGQIALLSWTPEGFLGQMLATMKPYAAPPAPGAQPAPLWGSEPHVTALLGDRVTEVEATRKLLTVDHFADAAEFRDYFKAKYGPTIAVYDRIADDPQRTAELDAALVALAERHDRGGDSLVMDWEYLLLTARRA